MMKQAYRAAGIATAAMLSVAALPQANAASIDHALKAQPADKQVRYQYRNPKATLEFFGIKEGMTVAEALPGRGWYSKILLPVLGDKGHLIGIDYAMDMWGNFSFMTEEALVAKKTWVSTWTEQANSWRNEGDATVSAFQFDALPDDKQGSADAVLFIRALHNMSRFEEKDGFLTRALDETYALLKDEGIVGVVQHQAREDRPDEWATGSNGYLKKSALIEKFKAHGFDFVAASDVNENPKDQAGEGDNVWRLPPSLNGSRDDAEKKAAMEALGESHRMTLLFKKATAKAELN